LQADAPEVKLERIAVALDGKGFIGVDSKRPFRPWGVNYGNEGRLMEDFWDTEWQTIAGDFREIREMGGNVVRVHLQFNRFMDAADKPNAKSFAQLTRMLDWRNKLVCTSISPASRATARVTTWRGTMRSMRRRVGCPGEFLACSCGNGAASPAVFCYDLMNEPISPGDKKDKWYSGSLLGGYDFIQMIARDPAGRKREEIAIAWIDKLTAAIRERDKEHMVTVGMLPWVTGWKHLSGFCAEGRCVARRFPERAYLSEVEGAHGSAKSPK
jgi:hypothetical protein